MGNMYRGEEIEVATWALAQEAEEAQTNVGHGIPAGATKARGAVREIPCLTAPKGPFLPRPRPPPLKKGGEVGLSASLGANWREGRLMGRLMGMPLWCQGPSLSQDSPSGKSMVPRFLFLEGSSIVVS